jgi:hypothetical protein
MTTPTIDRAAFEALQQTAGAEFVGELVDTFLTEAPLMLQDLRDSLAAGDADRYRNTFGAMTLGALARDLELGGLDPVRLANAQPLDTLAAEYSRVAAALLELRNA